MSKTLIDLDDDLLRRAQEITGIPTKEGVVTVALEQMVRRFNLDRYAAFIAADAFDDLADPKVIRSAQR